MQGFLVREIRIVRASLFVRPSFFLPYAVRATSVSNLKKISLNNPDFRAPSTIRGAACFKRIGSVKQVQEDTHARAHTSRHPQTHAHAHTHSLTHSGKE